MNSQVTQGAGQAMQHLVYLSCGVTVWRLFNRLIRHAKVALVQHFVVAIPPFLEK